MAQFIIFCAVELLRLVTSDDIMASLSKKLSISIKIYLTAMESIWSVSKLSTESVGSRRELVANCVHTADADATQRDSCVASASRVCIGLYKSSSRFSSVFSVTQAVTRNDARLRPAAVTRPMKCQHVA